MAAQVIVENAKGEISRKNVFAGNEDDPTYVLLKQLVVKAGSVFERGPVRRDYSEPHYEFLITLSRDHTAMLTEPRS